MSKAKTKKVTRGSAKADGVGELPDDALIRGTGKVAKLVGTNRWSLLEWIRQTDETGSCTHPIGRLCFRDEANDLCIRIGDWRRYVARQKKRTLASKPRRRAGAGR